MATSPKILALRYRIWAYATPREWDVTIKELAEALEEPWQRVRNVLTDARWGGRVRGVSSTENDFGKAAGASRASERFIIRDVIAGRVEAGTL